jgi:hypothetical protein
MLLVSALEESFDLAWSFLKKSGELKRAAESANIIADSTEQQLRTGVGRRLMFANNPAQRYKNSWIQKLLPKTLAKNSCKASCKDPWRSHDQERSE